MKKLLTILFALISFAVFAQPGSISQSVIRSRVNDSTTVNGATSSGYGYFFWNNQKAVPSWQFWNGTSLVDWNPSTGGGGGGGSQDLQSVMDEGATANIGEAQSSLTAQDIANYSQWSISPNTAEIVNSNIANTQNASLNLTPDGFQINDTWQNRGIQGLADYSANIQANDFTQKNYVDAKVADAINNGTTTIAPSQNAVFDALALKNKLLPPNEKTASFTLSPGDTSTMIVLNDSDDPLIITLDDFSAAPSGMQFSFLRYQTDTVYFDAGGETLINPSGSLGVPVNGFAYLYYDGDANKFTLINGPSSVQGIDSWNVGGNNLSSNAVLGDTSSAGFQLRIQTKKTERARFSADPSAEALSGKVLTIFNSTAGDSHRFTYSGGHYFGTDNNTLISSANSSGTNSVTGTGIRFSNGGGGFWAIDGGGNATGIPIFKMTGGRTTSTNDQTTSGLWVNTGFASSGNSGNTYITAYLNNILNCTSGTQTAYGLYYNPTLTAVTGLTHYGIVSAPTAALSGFGISAPTATLHVVGSTKLQGTVTLPVAGNGILIKEGTNATMGTATLSAGTVTVNTTAVTANSRIFLTVNGGTLTNVGSTYISARTAGTSFAISSTNVLDASQVAWIIIEPAP